MTTELLGLPGAGKTYFARRVHGPFAWSKLDVASHIAKNSLQERFLGVALSSRHLNANFGLVRHAICELAKVDVSLRDQANESLHRIVSNQLMVPFLTIDLHEMMDSLYREMLMGLYCEREGLPMINDDGGVQRILSIIGLRHPKSSAQYKKEACSAIAKELTYVKKANILFVEPRLAHERCLSRPSGVPRLMGHLSANEINERFESATVVLDLIGETLTDNGVTVTYWDFSEEGWVARSAINPHTES